MKRCFNCKKKDYNFICNCEKIFCLNCLPWYNHSCEFNYKDKKKDILKDENPQVLSQKIDQI